MHFDSQKLSLTKLKFKFEPLNQQNEKACKRDLSTVHAWLTLCETRV